MLGRSAGTSAIRIGPAKSGSRGGTGKKEGIRRSEEREREREYSQQEFDTGGEREEPEEQIDLTILSRIKSINKEFS